jgi:hypothetical protein
MNFIFSLFLSLSISLPLSALATDYKLNSAIKNGNSVDFIKYEGAGQWGSYLAMNLPYGPMADLFQQLKQNEKKVLINRGEAHITVITPVEFWNNLRPHGVSIMEINQIAVASNIQNSAFDIICLGKDNALVNGKIEQTFYVVIESKDLLNIRLQIQKLLISKGGKPKDFEPKNYHPHITLGFTVRDLHESDGVIKDLNSCVGRIELIK